MIKQITIGLVAILLQYGVLSSVLPRSLVPTLPIIPIVVLANTRRDFDAIMAVFVIGLFIDMFGSRGLIGVSSVSLSLVYTILSLLSKHVYFESMVAVFIETFATVMIFEFLRGIITTQFIDVELLSVSPFLVSLSQALITAIVATLSVPLLNNLSSPKSYTPSNEDTFFSHKKAN